MKLVPVIVTAVPPPVGPLLGLTLVTVGAVATLAVKLAVWLAPLMVTAWLAGA